MAGGIPTAESRRNGQDAIPGTLDLRAIILLFSESDSKFTFSDSLLLMTIVINAGMAIRELIRSKRITAGKKSAETTGNDTAE